MSDPASPATIYLECPYSEKDGAKAAGARWDKTTKRWFVPPNLYPQIYRFNQWLPTGKIYLNCPFDQKDEAKKAGAKWDPLVKCWFVSEQKSACVPNKFAKWMTDSTQVVDDDGQESSSESSSPKKTKRGHSLDATRLRISENMTVSQLQAECRFRNIRGFSGKNKDWMLQQLTIGSVWQSLNDTPPSSVKDPSKGVAQKTPEKAEKVSHNKAKEDKATSKPNASKKAGTVAAISTTKARWTPVDLASFPRVTSSLTVVQLKHEFMHRHPNTSTGLSNKSKTWFLDELGEESIWTTAPEVSGLLTDAPCISKSLTVAQIVHELLTRNPSTKGLSSKSKDDLLKRAGVGSIWITASNGDVSQKDQAKGTTPARSNGKLKTSTTMKTTDALSSAKAKQDPLKKAKTPTEKGAAATSTRQDTPNSAKREPTKKPVPVDKKKPTAVGSSASKLGRPKKTAEAQVKTLSKKPAVFPPKAPSSSSIISVSTSLPQTQTIPTEVASFVVEVGAETSLSSYKRPQTVSSGMHRSASKKVKLEETVSSEIIPTVSSRMTADQLKAEFKARDPNIKGLSGKSKDWLISSLGVGSQVRGSVLYKEKADIEAAKLHTFTSPCHPHPLADSELLRAPVEHWGLATSRKRVNVCVCDVEHAWICKQTPYRSCERCDYDVCKACYDIECLPHHEKEKEVQRRLNEMAEEDRRLQEAYEREEEAERQRQERYRIDSQIRRERRLQELFGEDLRRFPNIIRKPGKAHTDPTKKLKYTVWSCDVHRKQRESSMNKEFNSSFANLEEANLRAEYVFYYDNPWGCDKDEVYLDKDIVLNGGLRYMRSEPDGRGSWTVSVLLSEVFEILVDQDDETSGGTGYEMYDEFGDRRTPRAEEKYAKNIRAPSAKHTNEQRKLNYTVWQSDGYDYDGWHSYEGPPDKVFNSSYDTLEEANERVEYVFYYQNPWGLQDEDEEFLFAETDKVTSRGFLFLECCPPDSSRWTVSVIPSVAFEHINL